MNIISLIACLLLQLTPPKEIFQRVTGEKIKQHIAALANDSLEGRGPASAGDRKATAYIVSQFKQFGLEPAGENDSYIQKVPLAGATVDPSATITIANGNKKSVLKYSTDYVAMTETYKPAIVVNNAEIVFVGYGIVAPEQQWDDYKDVDVRGKILLMMNNDPSSDDPKFFAGKGRTYYGRWTYKYEIAAQKGALGAIVIHTTPSAGYRYEVIQNSMSRENFDFEKSPAEHKMALKLWTTEEATRKYLQLGGYNLDSLMALAEQRSFKPIALGLTLSTTMKVTINRIFTNNIIGKVSGREPSLKNQYIIFTAHYDHFGVGRAINNDSIYNGALDNASGTSMLLALAEAFAASKNKPKRSLLFAAVAAEEQGLLGSKYLAGNPPVPAKNIAANINTDVINVFGRTSDITFQGDDRSSLGNDIAIIAKEMNLTVKPDPVPEQGRFYRSDHFSFAKVGIPAISVERGKTFTGMDSAKARIASERYTKDYHQPSDEMYSDWNYDGAVQEAECIIRLAWRVANVIEMPYWNKGDEFEAVRKKLLGK